MLRRNNTGARSVHHPYRSVLYMPGANARALDKARSLPADALILDLEDAVSPDRKADARNLVAQALTEGGYGARRLLVRINGLDTEWGAADLDAAIAMAPHAILLPKVSAPGDLAAAEARIAARAPDSETRLWAMMETPLGVLNAREIAAAGGRLEGFVLGTNDLAKDLQAEPVADRAPLLPALAQCLMAARAHGLVCVDGVYNAFKDDDGLRAECLQGRRMGFDGKTLIHPAQLDIANDVFAPDTAALDLARRQVAAFDEAEAAGQGVAVVDGRIVENLHAATARRLLAKADAIAQLGPQEGGAS